MNERQDVLNAKLLELFNWDQNEKIEWLSPTESDDFAEYYDQGFLDRLGVSTTKFPLHDFWPKSGPRWDGLGKTASGKVILVEAKAYIEEAVDFRSKAGPSSMEMISSALAQTKVAFGASPEASWEQPFYQYANRLAHLYYLRGLNDIDAFLLFLNFANARDVPRPCTVEQWQGAVRIIHKCLGLHSTEMLKYVGILNWSVAELVG